MTDAPPAILIHHSDRGTQYLSLRYTDRLAEAGIAPSVGSRGDSYQPQAANVVQSHVASALTAARIGVTFFAYSHGITVVHSGDRLRTCFGVDR